MKTKKPYNQFCLLTATLTVLTILYCTCDASAEFKPVFNPAIDIKRLNSEIKIDGRLDDSGWAHAVRAENFVERSPGENLEPDVPTIAFVTYDDNNLYVAFKCGDDPSQIRATMCPRDQYDGDDVVGLLLDTYGNASWAYEFFVNPYGIQKDRLWSSVIGEDPGFDLIWESAGAITDSGYQVEMAIPFSSLRFPNRDQQVWKIDFWRNHPRQSFKQYSWAAYNRNDQCWPCQWGTATGISNVHPGRGLEFLPSMIVKQAGEIDTPLVANAPFKNKKAGAELSLGGKYSVNSDITLEATYNPDFSQIETDAAQIDVNSTIALMYPERRPFFQEGSDIFQTPFNSFYSRTINDPQFAAKGTGRMGRYSVGYVSAVDENTPYIIPLEEMSLLAVTGKSTVNVLRASRSLAKDNLVGFMVTDRRFDGGGYGTILSADANIKLSDKYDFIGQYILSLTKEPSDSDSSHGLNGATFDNGRHTISLDGESFSGDAVVTQLRRSARNWSFVLDYDHTAPSYRTETGYDPWNDYRNLTGQTYYDIYPAKGIFEIISPQISFENRWSFDGDRKWSRARADINTNLRAAQTAITLSFSAGDEKWQGIKFNDVWRSGFFLSSSLSNKFGYSLNFGYGQVVARWLPAKGNETSFSASINFKPIDRLIISPTLDYAKSKRIGTGEELYRQTIAHARIRFQFNKEFATRLVIQYNDRYENWEIDPLFSYRINPFSVFYLGSTHNIMKLADYSGSSEEWRQTTRQFFMKLQYLFRI